MDAKSLQLLLAAEPSPNRLRALEKEFGAFPSSEDLLQWQGWNDSERERIELAAGAPLSKTLEAGAYPLMARDFPEPLANAAYPVPGCFLWGDATVLDKPTVAIVGTRSAGTYGKATAQKFGEALARAGVTVVSGGAIGIDASAHKAALDAGGTTAAVLGSGIDKVYPLMNRSLFERIRESGCLISQFAVGFQPSAYRFLVRNRLIAALSQAVLVIEAPARSGALATARAARELGRPIFAVPANIDSESFRGSHALIRTGATLVDHPDQIIEELGLESKTAEQLSLDLSPLQQKILEILSVQPLAAEFISERTGIEAGEVMAELTMLELEGKIWRDAGGYALRL